MLNTSIKKQPRRFALEALDVTDVFCDFDGTITRVDATDAVLEVCPPCVAGMGDTMGAG